MVSVNACAFNIFQKMVAEKELLDISVEVMENGSTVIDAGVRVKGGFAAGKYLTELCIAGLGSVTLGSADYDGVELPTIYVHVDRPAIALLGSQFAGWRISVGKYFAMGSGPARALALKPKELYEKIAYKDACDKAVLVLESDNLPTVEALNYIAQSCGVDPKNLYVAVAPTSSIAGSVQISGRIVETGLHKLTELGFDPKKVLYGAGRAPIAPSHPKFAQAMGRTNDMLLYAGATYFEVACDTDDEIKELVKKVPSSTSPAYGRPFYEIFKEANYDFYKIDPGLFAPALITVNNVKTGSTITAGRLNIEVLKRSIGLIS